MNRREFCGTLAAALGVSLVNPSLLVCEVEPFSITFEHPFLIQQVSFCSIGDIGSKAIKLALSEDGEERFGLTLPSSANPHFDLGRAAIMIPQKAQISLLGDPGARVALHGIEKNGTDLFYKTFWWKL